jgi:hypothetical protein
MPPSKGVALSKGLGGMSKHVEFMVVTDTHLLFLGVTRRFIVCRRTTNSVIASDLMGCQCVSFRFIEVVALPVIQVSF